MRRLVRVRWGCILTPPGGHVSRKLDSSRLDVHRREGVGYQMMAARRGRDSAYDRIRPDVVPAIKDGYVAINRGHS
jgi:hypothetical protein